MPEENTTTASHPFTDEAPIVPHTPTPWRVGGHPGDSSGSDWREVVTDAAVYTPSFVCSALEADARLIARAVNSHEAFERTLRWIADQANKGANGGLKVPGKATSVGDYKELMRAIRDAALEVLIFSPRGDATWLVAAYALAPSGVIALPAKTVLSNVLTATGIERAQTRAGLGRSARVLSHF